MTPELLNTIINGGGTAILVVLVWDMRREQRERDDKIWALLDWLIRREGYDTERVLSRKRNSQDATD